MSGARWALAALAWAGAAGAPRAATAQGPERADRAEHVGAPGDTTASPGGKYAIIAAASVAAATWNQAIGLPAGWPRTWRGYGARLGDQAGFAVAEESLHAGIGALVPWHAVRSPCLAARRGHPFGRRVVATTRCAVHDRFVAQNAAGEARPNVPFLGAVVGASAISLAWRPERADARQGQVFVATRIGIVLAGAVGKAMWEAWHEAP
jgi:hypothetical protein